MTRIRRHRHLVVAGAAATVAVVGGVGAYAAIGSASGGEPSSGAQVASVSSGPNRLLRANGLALSNAVPVLSLKNGDVVSLLVGSGTKCLVRTTAGHIVGESCARETTLAAGQGISVSDECGTSGHNLMEIIGLAPEGATGVRLKNSDGTSKTTFVVDGAFKFDGTNPGPSEAFPVGVEWLESGVSGAAGLPIVGDEFCLPAPSE